MKRLLALVLALLLPVCAMAETYGISIEIDVDEVLFEDYVKQWLSRDSAEVPEKFDLIVQIARRVMDGSSLHMVLQENAALLELSLAGGVLFDVAFHHLDTEKICITSSLLGKNALVEKASEADTDAVMDEIDWTSVGAAVENAVSGWIANMEPTTTYGSFIGDAFAGGTECSTWSFTDRDIAGLVSSAMTEEVRAAAIIVMNEMGLDGEALLNRFDQLNSKVADEDVYLYILRIVKGATGEVVGLSLTVVEDVKQVATLSLGLNEEEITLVAGIGLDNQNYWWEWSMSSASFLKTLSYSGKSREWVADKENSFAYVRAMEDPAVDHDWYFDITKSGASYQWDGAIYEMKTENVRKYLFSTNGMVRSDNGILSAQVSLGGGMERALSLEMNFGPAEKIPALADDLVFYDLTDPSSFEMPDALMDQMVSIVTARLMKLLPMDLIFQLNTPSLP